MPSVRRRYYAGTFSHAHNPRIEQDIRYDQWRKLVRSETKLLHEATKQVGTYIKGILPDYDICSHGNLNLERLSGKMPASRQ